MKFMLFATTALAATHAKRQLSTVTDAISAISSGTTDLDNGIKSFDASDSNAVVSLQRTAQSLIDTINNGNTAVAALGDLGSQAAQLAVPIQDLGALVRTTVDDLKAKKQDFVSAGVGGVVYDNAVQLQTAAQTFTATVLSKVPDNLQSLGNMLAQPIADALNDAVSSFADQQGGGGGSPTTTGGAAPTTTGGSAPATTTAAGNGTGPVYPTSTAPAATPTFTGAAVANAAGFGAVAMAVFAGAAML